MSRMALPACVVAVVAACLAVPLWFGMKGGSARWRGEEGDDGLDLERIHERKRELDGKSRAIFGRLTAKGRVMAELRACRQTLREAAAAFRFIDESTGRIEKVNEEASCREVIDWMRAYAAGQGGAGPGLAELLEAELEELKAEGALRPQP